MMLQILIVIIYIKRDYGIELSPKHDGYKRGLASMMYKFIDKKIGAGTKANTN